MPDLGAVTDAMVNAACEAQAGADWRSFDASLEWPVRAGLKAALAVMVAALEGRPVPTGGT